MGCKRGLLGVRSSPRPFSCRAWHPTRCAPALAAAAPHWGGPAGAPTIGPPPELGGTHTARSRATAADQGLRVRVSLMSTLLMAVRRQIVRRRSLHVSPACASLRLGALPPSMGLRHLTEALATCPQGIRANIWICGEKFSRLAREDVGVWQRRARRPAATSTAKTNWSNDRTRSLRITGMFVDTRVDLPIPSQ